MITRKVSDTKPIVVRARKPGDGAEGNAIHQKLA